MVLVASSTQSCVGRVAGALKLHAGAVFDTELRADLPLDICRAPATRPSRIASTRQPAPRAISSCSSPNGPAQISTRCASPFSKGDLLKATLQGDPVKYWPHWTAVLEEKDTGSTLCGRFLDLCPG